MRFLLRQWMVALLVLLAANAAVAAGEYELVKAPVATVLDGRLTVQTAAGKGEVPIHLSQDWNVPQPDVTRAVIIIHGWPRRDLGADEYIVKHAGAAARNTIFITPQFLVDVDVPVNHLSDATLRWSLIGWRQGYDAHAPAPISSFAAMDTIFQRLADRNTFPKLKIVVLAGHSAGGQFVQRYAAVGRGERDLSAVGIHVRYVVANPATYLYFDNQRMQSDGSFAAVDAKTCPDFSNWNVGLTAEVPFYVPRPFSVEALEKNYLARDVVYLLGTADNDPHADSVGLSCGDQIQGTTRYARGLAYVKYINLISQGHSNHRLIEVPNIAHSSYKMYGSACGLTALLDAPDCKTKE